MYRTDFLLLKDFLEWVHENFGYEGQNKWWNLREKEYYTDEELIEKFFKDIYE